MAVDKLIDSAKETACRTAEANAIRAKAGTSASITYDWTNNKGFADAIAAIPSGDTTVISVENPDGTQNIIIHDGGVQLEERTLILGASAPSNIVPSSGKDGMTQVSVTIDTSVVKAENIALGATILGVAGSHAGGGGVSAEPVTLTANGVYTAPSGKAYTPVTVSIPEYDGSVDDA